MKKKVVEIDTLLDLFEEDRVEARQYISTLKRYAESNKVWLYTKRKNLYPAMLKLSEADLMGSVEGITNNKRDQFIKLDKIMEGV